MERFKASFSQFFCKERQKLVLKCKIVFFEKYHIQVSFATELPQKSFWRVNGPLQILKP